MFSALFDIFRRARANQPLTPGERAFLRLLDGLALTFVVAAVPVVQPAVVAFLGHVGVAGAASGAGGVAWGDVLANAMRAGAVAVGLAVLKYVRAANESVLPGLPATGVGAGDEGGVRSAGTNGLELQIPSVILPGPSVTAEHPAQDAEGSGPDAAPVPADSGASQATASASAS